MDFGTKKNQKEIWRRVAIFIFYVPIFEGGLEPKSSRIRLKQRCEYDPRRSRSHSVCRKAENASAVVPAMPGSDGALQFPLVSGGCVLRENIFLPWPRGSAPACTTNPGPGLGGSAGTHF